MRIKNDPFKSNQVSAEDFLASLEFSSPTHNSSPFDYKIRYFHFLSGSENYLILPLNSLFLHLDKFFDSVGNAGAPIEAIEHDETKTGEFRIFDKKNMRFFDQVWEAESFIQSRVRNRNEKFWNFRWNPKKWKRMQYNWLQSFTQPLGIWL